MRLNEPRWQDDPVNPLPRGRGGLVSRDDDQAKELKGVVGQIDEFCERIAELKLARNDLDFELRQAKVIYFDNVGELYIQKMRAELDYKMLRSKLEMILTSSLTDEEIEEKLQAQFRKELDELAQLSSEQSTIFNERADVERLANVDSDLKKGIRSMYLNLAKKFHPDRFTDESKGKAEDIMKDLNEFYMNNDLHGMLELQKNVGIDIFDDLQESIQDKINRAKSLVSQLQETYDEFTDQIKELKSSQLYTIKKQMDEGWKKGRDVISDLAGEIKKEIESVTSKLTSLKKRVSNLGLS